jgi:uncharacterized membrane protein YdjX (TVP38/TMEM64 family)
VSEFITGYVQYIQQLGWLGPLAFAVLYTALAAALIPGSFMTMIAGFVWGPVYGLAIASPSSMIASSATFALSRTVLRGWAERKIRRNPGFAKLDHAVGKSGFKVVALTRLSPLLPYTFLNYALGLTKVRFRDYFFGSLIGMFPATVLYAYIGSAARSIAAIVSGDAPASTGAVILYWAGLAATVIVSVYLARMARRAF